MKNNKECNVVAKEAFYATVIFVVEDKLVMVKHHKGSVYKIPGGTFSGSKEKWDQRGEGGDFFDNFSKRSIKNKFFKSIKKMLGVNKEFVTNLEIYEKAGMLADAYSSSPVKPTAAIEFIEEPGLIPFDLELFHHQIRGIQQFFYICKEAFAFNKDKQKFVLIKKLSDLPENGRDYFCQDSDIEKILTLEIDKLDNNEINFAHSHKEPLRNFLMKNIAESRM